MTVGIYAIENIETGDRYVGQSVDIEKRWVEHRADLNRGEAHSRALQESWNYYGEQKFRFVILEQCERRLLDERERVHMRKGSSLNHSTGYVEPLAIEARLGRDPNEELIIDFDDLLDESPGSVSINSVSDLCKALEDMAVKGSELEGLVQSVDAFLNDSGLIDDPVIERMWDRAAESSLGVAGAVIETLRILQTKR